MPLPFALCSMLGTVLDRRRSQPLKAGVTDKAPPPLIPEGNALAGWDAMVASASGRVEPLRPRRPRIAARRIGRLGFTVLRSQLHNRDVAVAPAATRCAD